MLHEQLRNAWHARKRVVPISPVLNLTPEGLVLGAGTVLVPADGPRRLKSLRGQEARVLALLSAAYGRAIAPSVLGNIERSAKAWSEGDDCLAGAVVTYDDCQKTSGILFEIKGEEYAALLQIPQAEDSIRKQFSDQALRQVQASSGRPLVWIFAEPEAADFARELFNSNKDLERIFVVPMPWLKRESR